MRILITGSASGIGHACAIYFMNKGHQVIGIDILPKPDSLDHPNYTHICYDVTEGVVDIPSIDILINNVGVQNSNDDIEINLKSVIRLTEHYIKQKQLKSIVMVASTSAHNGAEFPEYAASKGGLLTYTKNVAKRVAAFGCTCNSISPGGVLTALNNCVIQDKQLWDEIMSMTPLKKWMTPEECAEWIYFLSVVNKSMTGQDIIVDNGEMINHKFVWAENS